MLEYFLRQQLRAVARRDAIHHPFVQPAGVRFHGLELNRVRHQPGAAAAPPAAIKPAAAATPA